MSVYATASKNRTLVFTGGTLQTGFASVEALEQERDERIAADNAEAAARIAGDLANAGFDDLPQLLADNSTLQVGSIVLTKKEQFSFEVVSSDPHLTTSGGSMLRVVGDRVRVEQFGASGDGVTDDLLPFQAGLDYVSGTGRTLIAEKSYSISGRLLAGTDFTLDGGGSGLIRRDFNTSPTGAGVLATGTDAKNVSIFGITFDGNGQNFPQSHNIISVDGFNNFIIERCTFLNVVDFHAIDISNGEGFRITNCYFRGYADKSGTREYSEAIQFDHGGETEALPISDIVITGCFFGANPDNTDPDFAAWPCAMGNHSTNKVGASINRIRFSENNIINATYAGVRLYAFRDININDNTISGAQQGVLLERGGENHPFGCKNIVVSGNTFRNCGKCVYALNTNYLIHSDNHSVISISGNTAFNCSSFCRLYSIEDMTISGNTFLGSGSGPFIVIPNDRDNVAGRLTVSGNTADNISAFSVISMASSDILIEGNNANNISNRFVHVISGPRVTITGNTVTDCSGPNFVEVNSSNNCTISGNAFLIGDLNLQPSGSEVIRSTAGGRVTVQDNSIGSGMTAAAAFVNNGNFFSGVITGNPEGNITAGVGSRVTRRDGGAGATFYVKESGTGNTGWVAK